MESLQKAGTKIPFPKPVKSITNLSANVRDAP